MDDGSAKKPNFFERVLSRLSNDTPENADEILEVLRAAADNEAVDSDTLQLLENVLDFSDMEVRDVMITRSQMDVIKASDSIERIIAYIQETAHSRFPVIGEDKDEILGILHAKDLLRYFGQPEQFQLKQVLRPAMFVPESKALNNVIKDFRTERNHMAIVIDEYGGVSGLITLEDVSEQIMGDIEDEFDLDDSEDQIFAINPERFRVITFEGAFHGRTLATIAAGVLADSWGMWAAFGSGTAILLAGTVAAAHDGKHVVEDNHGWRDAKEKAPYNA